MVGRIVYVLFILVIGLYGLASSISAFDYSGTTFYGDKQFENFQQAQEFQAQLVAEAEKDGAKVDDFTLTIQSPPKVSWRVKMPQSIWDEDLKDFAYGERGSSIGYCKGSQIAIMVLCFGMMIFTVWILLFRKSKVKEENEK